jgi:uncharacterized protein (UPF0332 family)
MTAEERTLVKYRLERAHETLREAKLLFDSGLLIGYVNRLYYACFYAVSAFLLLKGFSTSKHSYARSLVHRELVKTHLISVEMGNFYDSLFENRQKGDYTDMMRFDAKKVAPWFDKTSEFIKAISNLLTDG